MRDGTGIVVEQRADRRSTSAVGREAVAAALDVVDSIAAGEARSEKDWRRGYPRHFRALAEAAREHDDRAAEMALAGIHALRTRMRWTDPDAPSSPDASPEHALLPREPFRTRSVPGAGERVTRLELPYGGQVLHGDPLRARLDAWVADGVIEPGAAEAVRAVIDNPRWLDARDLEVAVFGATAELCPLEPLVGWGATVLAVSRPRAATWEHLTRTTQASAGTLRMPVRYDEPGADFLTDTGDIAAWLLDAADPTRRLVLGNYLYGDGSTNLRLAVGGGLVAGHVRAARPDTALAFLATPTDSFVVPPEVVATSRAAYEAKGWLTRAVSPMTGRRLLTPHYPDGAEFGAGIADAIVPQQGPNYLLAKRVHRWRATAARAEGAVVSMNVAPPTRTRSVTKRGTLAAAYAGASRFGIEVFEADTSRVLMAALLLFDLRTGTTGHPGWRAEAERACHGGLWTAPYEPRSALPLAAVLGASSARTVKR